MEKDIVIVGHSNPDIDSILSGIILSKYLVYKGYKARYVIPDKSIDKEVEKVLNHFKIDFRAYQEDIPENSSLILVDHHETVHKNEVLAVIDHHPTIKEFNYPVYINKKASSTTKVVYDTIVKEGDLEFFTKDTIELVVVGILIDTCSFKSSKINPDDIDWTETVCAILNIDLDELKEIGYCLTDTSDITKSAVNGFKEFKYGDKVVRTSYIQCSSFDFEIINEHIDFLQDIVIEEGIYMWMFMAIDVPHEKTIEYRIYPDEVDEFHYKGIVSRGATIMPNIEKSLAN